MENTIQIVINVVTFLTGVGGGFLGSIYYKNKRQHGLLIALTGSIILDKIERYVKRGWATLPEKQHLNSIFSLYENEGGNGVVADEMQKFKELPSSYDEHNKRYVFQKTEGD